MSDARALIIGLPNPVVLVGAEGRIDGLNAPAIRLIGTDASDWHYITALRQPALLDAVEATLSDGGQRHAAYLGNDGARDTTWNVSVRGVAMSDGLTVVLSFQDMTALEEAGEMRRDFVANVSHELRTPLTSLMGFIETLRGPAKDDSAARDRFLGIMEQEAGRMCSLVEALLQLSRVEAQERIRPTTKVALQTLVHEVLNTLQSTADTKGLTFDVQMPDTPIDVLGDRDQLWQVISNLVENAMKYGATSGAVMISLSAPDHEPTLLQTGVRLCVIDQGDGIPAHHIARLTERFYRVDSHRNRKVGGTGLGLAIVKHIVNRHRGRLRINSIMGQSTEFKVIIPVDADSGRK